MDSPLVSAVARGPAANAAQLSPRPAQDAPQARSAEAVAAPPPEQLQQAVRDIQRAVESMTRELNFSIDQESGKTVIRVVDTETQKLIRQIPSEEVMSISRALSRLTGFLLEEHA